ncbi:hypothetical protein [Paludibaculum fermentans]|uniref:Uncharacterized protein n=1 Tax=Paludibaculum fermentans TaxID=1473598 RepID=A0A7S7NQ76_PALFE|nr:hypothetical protein [Paludibaculum fermentans]QOY87762.1 hypothetical protein IRI77_34310 [Paludibaculum fermentans]
MKKLILLIVIVAVGVFAYRSCRSSEPPATTSKSSAPVPAASTPATPPAEVISGSSLNKAFPQANGDFKLTFTQEKDGFAQAELSRAGAKVAALTISDTGANPSARTKFAASTRKIGGYPAAAVGSQGTAVLVADRYQVQVRSLGPTFTPADRDAWLEKFKLDALAAIRK